jgi:F0F1-type ATP synthase assembly protein I
MIKSLLNADEDPPPGTKVVIEDSVVTPPAAAENSAPPTAAEATVENPVARPVFEIPGDAQFFTPPAEEPVAATPAADNSESFPKALAESLNDEPEIAGAVETNAAPPIDEDSELLAALAAELENLAPEDLEQLEREIETRPAERPEPEKSAEQPDNFPSGTLFQSEPKPQSRAETFRQSGLAYSAAIVLFGSVIFMMIFGWFADLLLGSSPWGIVGGIVLGGIIGFIQFFRITAQIFKK